ncbi:MAG: SRPBCC family protein [Gemmatimonadaceae bacterium]
MKTTINAPPAAVWKALTTPSALKKFFFGSDIVTDWRVGSPIRFRGDWKGKPYEDKGTIQSFDVDRRVAFTHWSPLSKLEDKPENYHIVSFDLRPLNGGTEVVLTQTNQSDSEPLTPENRKEYANNWTILLDGLKKVVESPGRTEKPSMSAEARS